MATSGTPALLEQQARGLKPEDAWWVELLETGTLWGADPAQPHCAVSNSFTEEQKTFNGTREVRRRALYDQARAISPRLKGTSDTALGLFLRAQSCVNKRVLRARGWEFPSLQTLRKAWERRYPGWSWRDPELKEWQAGE